jgi:hypothetical protein
MTTVVTLLSVFALSWASLPCVAEHCPSNVYRASPRLPHDVRRIAVLPVTVAEPDLTVEIGRDDLEPVVSAELRKANVFEVIVVSREQLRGLTGRTEWTAKDKLPLEFFERLRAATGCDAVMFCQLVHYRPYTPIAVGWDIKLVDSRKPQILWAIDEVFSAGDGATARAARHYCAEHIQTSGSGTDSWSILQSPRRFTQYTANAVFATLPSR